MIKLVNKFLKKQKKVFYSCVVDNDPKFYWQGYIFVNSLIKLAKVSSDRIFVHMTSKNDEFEKFLNLHNVNIIYIAPWGDKKYCNKLQQLETKELKEADFVFFCDADIAITEDLSYLVQDSSTILGKLVDFDNPDIETLKKIYDDFQIDFPALANETLNARPTFETNFNGGLYGIPSNILNKFSEQWKSFADKMLQSNEIKSLLGKKINHVDQISFSLTLQSLKYKYKLLDYEFNCPTHIKDFTLLTNKIKENIKVIHYHSNLSPIGLLNLVNVPYMDNSIQKVNDILQEDFNNEMFWNYRYKTNPNLGSGVGSRGDTAIYKLQLLKDIGVEKDESVLDIGCGDLEIVKNLKLKTYTGVDISDEALRLAKSKYPEHKFINMRKKENIHSSNTVLCLDVLIHQRTKEDYDDLIRFISTKATKRVIVSGYELKEDSSHMCFFYENIKKSLESTKKFKYIFKVGEYRGLGVYIADKGELSQKNTPNDINNTVLDDFLQENKVNNELLLESVVISRNYFGWYTKHYPRLYEYPWLLEKLGRNLKNLKIADFGAGVTPLPIQLAQRGANVYTIDKHNVIRTLDNVKNANEWGFFDYNVINKNITSYNNLLDEKTFKHDSLDVWYSISVVEHMPAIVRRMIFKIMADSLKNNGLLFLTIDLEKNSQKLWNMSEGKVVEDEQIHGTLEIFIKELESLSFKITEKRIINMPDDERVDIALISGKLCKDAIR